MFFNFSAFILKYNFIKIQMHINNPFKIEHCLKYIFEGILAVKWNQFDSYFLSSDDRININSCNLIIQTLYENEIN